MPDNSSPHDLFISYSRKNKDVVLPVKNEFERIGLTCWIDLSDIPCGTESFKKKVIPGIRQARIAFLFFLSAESQSSEYAMKEINFAKKRAGKQVILVRFNDDELTDEFFFDYQDADIIDWRVPEQREKLLRELRSCLGNGDPTSGFQSDPAPMFVGCPICGKKNHPENTFKCRKCGRDNLCLRHQDETTFLCKECTARPKRNASHQDGRMTVTADPMTCDPTFECNSVETGGISGAPKINRFCFGKVIGGFKVLESLQTHTGAQGNVYKAVCVDDVYGLTPVGAIVALKVMSVQDEDRERWCRLVKCTKELSKFDHPNVVKYFGCFSERRDFMDIHVVVQEFLNGETLKDRMVRFPFGLDADEAVKIVDSALAGLSYTASHGLVHRDVKPGNIFVCLDAEGGIDAVKLIDFELARWMGHADVTTPSKGNLRGSFDYMAPDFIDSGFYGDEQSDVFSMGVVLHEVLTGKPPYPRINADEKQTSLIWLSRWTTALSDGDSPIKVLGRANRLLTHADEVLSRSLSLQRKDRYKGFLEFREGMKGVRLRNLRNNGALYQLLQFVGKGGFGEVFKARHIQTGRVVAIKHLLRANFEDRFSREAKILKKIEDPCVVKFIDYFAVNHVGGREAFLVMDFLPGMPGSSLRDAIRRAKGAALPCREALLAFTRFAHGLSVLHSKGIIHRDIKPSNLFYPEGHPERVAIMDFAIALDANGTVTYGGVPGTLDYMPPELVLNSSRGNSASDIYALGLSLYEALTGKTAYPRLPMGAAAFSAILARAQSGAMPVFSDPIIAKNAALHDLLVRMTHPCLTKRLADAREVELKLSELAEVAKDKNNSRSPMCTVD